ncbi:MAG: conjugal transfer protein TrbD [Granulosicoccus sp.]
MEQPDKRIAPLRQSIYRQATVFGAERTPMLILLCMSVVLIVSAMTLLTTVIGLTLIVIGGGGLRHAAKAHPQATKVYMEFLRYRRYYPARQRFPNPMPYSEVHEQSQRYAS